MERDRGAVKEDLTVKLTGRVAGPLKSILHTNRREMRIAKVIGTVTLNRCLPSYRGAKLKVVLPLQLEDVVNDTEQTADTLVAWDELGAGYGHCVALSEGPEAAQPFRPEIKPIEALTVAILDELDVDHSLARPLLKTATES